MSRAHVSRSRWSRALLLAWSVPLLFLGPVLDGRALLWHAHADVAAHLHVLSEPAHEAHARQAHEPRLASAHHQHEDEHHEHGDEHHQGTPTAPGEHRESDCFIVSFAGPFLPGGSVRAAPAQRALQGVGVPLGSPAALPAPVQPSDAGPPPGRLRAKLRSGTALLVATSHALLI